MEEVNTLVVISNQYMLSQFEWYYSHNSTDKCDAVIVNFDSLDLLEIMQRRCEKSGLFCNVYVYNNLLSKKNVCSKIILMLKYVVLNITRRKNVYDLKLVESVTGEKKYQKVIVPSNYITFCVAAINAYPNAQIVCMEDGFADYCEYVKGIKKFSFDFIFKWLLAKLDILNYNSGEYHFVMKNDYRIIKYVSLPEKLKYKEYKEIRQLFYDRNKEYTNGRHVKEQKEYDVILFSTRFEEWVNDTEKCYSLLYQWIKKECSNKSVLIKKHPKEKYEFLWNDTNIHIYDGDLSGEELLDIFPESEVVMVYTSTLLLKLCREKRNFRILRLGNISNEMYYKCIDNDSKVVELDESVRIDLYEVED